jgi:hypothetical protein
MMLDLTALALLKCEAARWPKPRSAWRAFLWNVFRYKA